MVVLYQLSYRGRTAAYPPSEDPQGLQDWEANGVGRHLSTPELEFPHAIVPPHDPGTISSMRKKYTAAPP